MSFVNEIYIFRHDVRQITAIYAKKMLGAIALQKPLIFFQQKNISKLDHINVCVL